MDGIDAVLADFNGTCPRVLEATSLDLPVSLRQALLALQHPSENELRESLLLAQELAKLYARACLPWINGPRGAQVRAIGVHGQTVRHDPLAGYTLQLNAPALMAELCGKDIIADFRSRDMAAGGQGAPLVPIVHHHLFDRSDVNRVVLNLGGIANISILQAGKNVWGFDTGPANMLMDAWIQEHQGRAYDKLGAWAQSAQADQRLLQALLAEPWFDLAPPKSTGRDLFNMGWLRQHLNRLPFSLSPAQVQATLLELSANSISQAIKTYAAGTQEILVCGGGAYNPYLVSEIARLSGIPVRSTQELGIDPQHIEALTFAWLAYAHLERIPASLPAVTGARHARVLGACYPA